MMCFTYGVDDLASLLRCPERRAVRFDQPVRGQSEEAGVQFAELKACVLDAVRDAD